MEVLNTNGISTAKQVDIAKNEKSSSNEVSADGLAEASIIDRIAEELPPVCLGRLPDRVRRAIELTHCLKGPALERAIENIPKGDHL